jgi:N-acetylglucosamine-6-phosphate deacetylase
VSIILSGGRIITPDGVIENHALIIEGGIIAGIIPQDQVVRHKGDHNLNTAGKWIAPGLIDIHVHGSDLSDAMDATPESVQKLARFFASRGVSSFLLTTGTASKKDLDAVIENYTSLAAFDDGACPLGIHLEGPYLSEARKGAQPAGLLRDPDPSEYRPWFNSGAVRLMTIAPELPGAMELIDYGFKKGIQFAVGHSVASFEIMEEAIERGLRQATHTFNGMDPLHHREPGVVGAVLSDERVFAQVIPDGIHVHPAVVKLLAAAKGADRTVLITDAIRAAGMGDGEYDLLGQTVTVKANTARVASGSLAGSVLTMDQAVRNVMEFCGLGFPEAVKMASSTPAHSLNLEDRGWIKSGMRADITVFNLDYRVEKTLVGGKILYTRD